MTYNSFVIGPRYCANNCPFQVRRFQFSSIYTKGTWTTGKKDDPEVIPMSIEPGCFYPVPRVLWRSVPYCVQRIKPVGKIDTKLGNESILNQPADGNGKKGSSKLSRPMPLPLAISTDDQSVISVNQAQRSNYVMLEELGIRPRTSLSGKISKYKRATGLRIDLLYRNQHFR